MYLADSLHNLSWSVDVHLTMLFMQLPTFPLLISLSCFLFFQKLDSGRVFFGGSALFGLGGPKGPTADLIRAVVEMKQRNPTWGCPHILPIRSIWPSEPL